MTKTELIRLLIRSGDPDEKIRNLTIAIEEVQDLIATEYHFLRSPKLEWKPRSNRKDYLECTVIQLITKLKKRLCNLHKNLSDAFLLKKAMLNLSDIDAKIIEYRYFSLIFKSFHAITKLLNRNIEKNAKINSRLVNTRWVIRHHSKALSILCEFYNSSDIIANNELSR